MIKEAFRDDKNFIVARIKSRGNDKFLDESQENVENCDVYKSFQILKNEGSIICNHFNLYSIIKLIFHKRGDDYIGRFHPDYLISV